MLTTTTAGRDAVAIAEFLVANPQWHFDRYKDVRYASLAFVVEHADRVRVK